MQLGTEVGLGPGHTVLDGDPAPPPQRGTARNFGPYLLRPNGCMDQDATRHGACLGPGDLVLDGDPAPGSPPQKGGGAPKFSAHVYCGQTAGWIKMVLGTAVGLSPGDFVLDGDPARPLNFRPMFITVIVISLEHCTLVIGLFTFKFKF